MYSHGSPNGQVATNGNAGAAAQDAAGAAARQKFLAKVRKALGHEGAAPAPTNLPPTDETLIRQVAKHDPHRAERWIQYAKTNGIHVARVSPAGVLQAVDDCLAKHTIKRVLLCSGQPGVQCGLASHLLSQNLRLHMWGEPDSFQAAFNCDAAITDCRYAIADSGGFVVWSDPNHGRSVTLTTPVHIVLLPAERIVADLVDGLHLALSDNHGRLPSNVIVINGPSKTTDIESNLVTGVHGPKYLYAIVIE